MKKGNWSVVGGMSNLGEDCVTVAGILNEDSTQVAFAAYSGLKILNITGIDDMVEQGLSMQELQAVNHVVGDFWDVTFKAIVNGEEVLVVVNECDSVTLIDAASMTEVNNQEVEIDYSEEFDASMYDELDSNMLYLFDYL